MDDFTTQYIVCALWASLTNAAHGMGECYAYAGDDGRIYLV